MGDLGRRIKRAREIRGLSLAATAAAAGTSAAYVQKLERGEVKSPSPHRLLALADALEVPYAELMQLAGYEIPAAAPPRNREALAPTLMPLAAEEPTTAEVEDLTEYLRFRRAQRRREEG